jgi:L-threonylcarbamoyladenylate synthase
MAACSMPPRPTAEAAVPHATHPSIATAAAVLRAGGLVAFPTETVYGLGADALNPDAVRKVFELKGRPHRNPLIVHVADIATARAVASEWPPLAQRLAERFWPGPLTIVVPKHASIPTDVTAGTPTVGIRCPDHPMALDLLRAFGGPLVAPSANPSGFVSPTTADHVREGFPGAELLVLDGGPCRAGIESTVVSLTMDPPTILRTGAIPIDDLRAMIPTLRSGAADALGSLGSPGRLPSHYAPRAAVRLVSPAEIRAGAIPPGSCALVMSTDYTPAPGAHIIAMPEDALAYAARLYAALREADAIRPAEIIVELPESSSGLWEAIHDRLRRAAAPRT